MPTFDTIVLAGGAGRRLGHVDKAALSVAGRSLLERVLAACSDARETVVVGPTRPTGRRVRWAREDPPGTGPLAGIAAGLAALADPQAAVVVLACDLPFITCGDVTKLVATLPGHDAVLLTDDEGRLQPLAAGYDSARLAAAVAAAGDLRGLPVNHVLRHLRVHAVPADGAAQDCDTPEQLAAARAGLS